MFVIYFLLWTLVLYWIHRVAHVFPYLKDIHKEHHRYVIRNKGSGIALRHLLLIHKSKDYTIDLWITEVVPTILFSLVTGQVWILIVYYIWAALFQTSVKYDVNFDIFPITWGAWTLLHYRHNSNNFGSIFTIWDRLFKTNKGINQL
jgi:sterol desaturase/sphingolipid hydroxylase (fatty acid hydroxylase superfamily)